MPSHRSASPILEPDERSPLLVNEDPTPDTNVSSSDEDDLSSKQQDAPASPWRYAWYGLWACLTAAILAVFVKACIDTDVNVGVSLPTRCVQQYGLDNPRSLTLNGLSNGLSVGD